MVFLITQRNILSLDESIYCIEWKKMGEKENLPTRSLEWLCSVFFVVGVLILQSMVMFAHGACLGYGISWLIAINTFHHLALGCYGSPSSQALLNNKSPSTGNSPYSSYTLYGKHLFTSWNNWCIINCKYLLSEGARFVTHVYILLVNY